MDAEFSRFVACRRDDATLAGIPNRQWQTSQGGIVALFDGCIKRIHIDMDDTAETGILIGIGMHGERIDSRDRRSRASRLGGRCYQVMDS
jgi:hypothetical protein